jgi:solute carrier family 25 protein 38
VLLQPLDLLKTRLQQPHQYQQYEQPYQGRIWHETQRIIRQHGIIGLWRGTLPTLIR